MAALRELVVLTAVMLAGCYLTDGAGESDAVAPDAASMRDATASIDAGLAEPEDARRADARLDVDSRSWDSPSIDAPLVDARSWFADAWFTADVICPPPLDADVIVSPATIDRIRVDSSWDTYGRPPGGLRLLGSRHTYVLSDGSTWRSGAGSFEVGRFTPLSVAGEGARVRFLLETADALLGVTDYDSGDHSAHFELRTVGPVELEGERGSRRATVRIEAVVVLDQVANYRDARFHPLSVPVCARIGIEGTIELEAPTSFDERLLETEFRFRRSLEIVFVARP